MQELVGDQYRLTDRLDQHNYLAKTKQGEEFLVRTYPHAEPQRLLRHVVAYRGVSHPNLVPFVDGKADGDLPWMARPHVRGTPLLARLDEGPEPPEQVILFLDQALRALEYLHARRLVYANWSLTNIMEHEGRWSLLDVGEFPNFTRPPLVVGRPDYGRLHLLAPESLKGEPPTIESDLFSLGAAGYTLLAGTLPFGDLDSEATLLAFKLISEDPTPLLEHQPNIPPALAQVVHDLLKKDPDERPGDIPQLLARLKEKPPTSTTPSGPELSSFLNQAGKDGRKVDESGRFTLDPKKALEKLKQFQFQRPHDFLLPLVAAGVAMGAKTLTFTPQKAGLELHFDSPELSEDQFRQLFLAAAARSSTNPLSHLGLGIVGALGAGATVALSSGRWKTNLEEIADPVLKSARNSGVTLSIRGEGLREFPPELLERVALCPAKLDWSGKVLNPSRGLEQLGESGGYQVFGAVRGREPGVYLRVNGLAYRVGATPSPPGTSFGPKGPAGAVLVLDGPWPLDLSYQGIPHGARREDLESLAWEMLLKRVTDLLLEHPINLQRPELYFTLTTYPVPRETLEKFHHRVVLAAPEIPGASLSWRAPGEPQESRFLATAAAQVRTEEKSSSRKAARLLTAPAVYDNWPGRSWTDALSIARQAYPAKAADYWRFLLRSWVKHGGRPEPRTEVSELLKWLREIPESEQTEWDLELRLRLRETAAESSEPTTQLCAHWESCLPPGFSATREWLNQPNL